MSAAVIVEGVAEGLELLDNLVQAASSVSTAVKAAQASGTPLDWTTVLSAEATAENAVLAAIAQQKAAGK